VKRSESRILTTHTGSLPRSDALVDMLVDVNAGRLEDRDAFDQLVREETDRVVRQQIAAGVDIGSDGEMPRVAFHLYVKDRMSGFGGRTSRRTYSDIARFPAYAALKLGSSKLDSAEDDNLTQTGGAPAAVDRMVYDPDLREVRSELGLFAEALERTADTGGFVETFVSAASPGIISCAMTRHPENPAYATDEEYVLGIAEEMRKEYEYVVSQGHILQLDCPDLAMERTLGFQDEPLGVFLDRVELHIEAINRAIANIPRDRVRLHACWGNYDGPHIDDVELEEVLPFLYRANVGALSLPCGNPRHQHDWKVFRKLPLPDGLLLITGVIDVTTNYVEHPEVVADRICQFAETVGDPTRLIASTDCGFGTNAGYVLVADDVVWAKLEALSEGAARASERLFG
jgi:5-methyltetrahydropteroyltriglutamate--homocysteine methyltransferase